MKKIVVVLLTVLLIAACSSGKNDRPQDIREKIWNEGQQIAITIKHNVDQEKKDELKELAHVTGTYGRYKNREDAVESEINLIEAISELYYQSLFFGIFGEGVENNEGYYKALKVVEGFYGEEALDYANYDVVKLEQLFATVASDQLKREQDESVNGELEHFKNENKISLDAKTVQYDMANNLDKSFAISGTLELDDYFNYGFDNEEMYFSSYIIPDDGTYSDGWYIYFQREGFKELFDELLKGKKHILVEAKIPSYMYEKGQGKMALAEKARW